MRFATISQGYGFVDYVEKESGQKALDNIDGMSIDGRELAIKTSEDRYDFGGGRGGRGDFRGGRGDRGRGGGDFRGRGRGGDRGGDRGGYSDRGARDGAETNVRAPTPALRREQRVSWPC